LREAGHSAPLAERSNAQVCQFLRCPAVAAPAKNLSFAIQGAILLYDRVVLE